MCTPAKLFSISIIIIENNFSGVHMTLHNEMGTWGAPMTVIYVPGVRIYAQRYFSALKVLFPPVSQMPDPGVRTIRILPVSDA